MKHCWHHTKLFSETQKLQSSAAVGYTMVADYFRFGAQVVGMVSIPDKLAISTLLDASGKSECTQRIVKQNVLFVKMVDSEIELELEPSMIPVPLMPDQLRH